MIKKYLFGAMMLSLCFAALPAQAAFATEVSKPVAAEESSPEVKELYNRQIEIDKLLLEDNAKKIEEMGFMVNSTAVVDNAIEIAISPYSEENANFIYELVGKDNVKVIEMDQSILYASSAAPDQAVSDADQEEVKVYKGDATDAAAEEDLSVTSDSSDKDDTMEIQIESVNNPVVDDKAGEIQTVSAETTSAKDENTSAPGTVIAIAFGAVLLGGVATLTAKKRRK